jgi:hypothetical protein
LRFGRRAIASGPGSDGFFQLDLLNDIISVAYGEIELPQAPGAPGEVITISAVPTFPAEAVKPVREVVARLKLTEAGARELMGVIRNHLEQLPESDAKPEA